MLNQVAKATAPAHTALSDHSRLRSCGNQRSANITPMKKSSALTCHASNQATPGASACNSPVKRRA
jgi:hypothetical protein